MMNLKKLSQVYAKCIFSGSGLNVPGICLAYPCHKRFLFPAMLPANELMPEFALRFDLRTPLHSVHQARKDLLTFSALSASFARLRWAYRRRHGVVRRGGRGGRQHRGRQCRIHQHRVCRRLLRRATKCQGSGRHHSTDVFPAVR